MKKVLYCWLLISLCVLIWAIFSNGGYVRKKESCQRSSEVLDSFLLDTSFEKNNNDSSDRKGRKYKEILHPTPNILPDRINTVEGVVLHHTAEPTIERSLGVLTSSKRKVGTHVVIDTDGTRYIMANPEVVTFHAGPSVLNGKDNCNDFTIGVEFQGNTLERPLTEDQINSAIQYLLPLIEKNKIPLSCIVTHEMIRCAYKTKYPNKKCSGKVDITQVEYKRFMKALKNFLNKDKQT